MAKPMAKNQNIIRELKALGMDLSDALKQMRTSREFHEMRQDVANGVKSIAESLVRSLKAARKSEAAKKIKRRVNRVVEAGAAEGKRKAERAQAAASHNLRKVRSAVKQFSSKLKKR